MIRCIEHTIQLSAKAFIETIYPTCFSSKSALSNDNDADWEALDAINEEEDVDNAISFNASDVIGMVLAFITQVCLSHQAKKYFAVCYKEESLPQLELKKWVCTHWGSMFDLVDHFVTLRKAVNKFIKNADESGSVPKLKGKIYMDYYLMHEDSLDVFHKLEEYLSTPVEVISSIKYPTLGAMARDCLALPGSSVSSERAFSSSGHTDTQTCNSLGEGTFSALQIAKDGYGKGIINGGKEALTWEPKDWIME
ncbi:hypothetical protein D9756_006426 [Leucocoprinus leucothites]|uniref:HAT C-terminal dimerisation domain-containing protein n=1 Tax=Leucocoprinus leucothites TaxID=201217 RepID=A0A8H5G221_9AGAR|nr:hypothetical protein D9756_006426 [Leucoagaricus leucothites]